MSQFDYKLVLDVNRAYAVAGSRRKLDDLFDFLRRNDFQQIYDDAGISEENRDIHYGTVKEFDMSNKSDAEKCTNFLNGRHSFRDDVLVRVRNADDAPEELREDLEHGIKTFHEQNSFKNGDPSTCVLVSGTDSLTKYDHTLSGRIFGPPELK